MDGLVQVAGVLLFMLVAVSMLRGVIRVLLRAGQDPAQPASRPADYDPEQAARTRRIQEEIRRKIAERRGLTGAPAPGPVESADEPPFIAEEVIPAEPVVDTGSALILERQQQLSDQMRALEAARVAEQRRATRAAGILNAGPAPAQSAAQPDLLADLRDPASLQRAWVLREVLGPPVALR